MAAIPVALTPLLISAARPPALDSIHATCSLEDTTYAPAQTPGANVSYRQPAGAQSEGVESANRLGSEEGGVNSFVRDRWNAVRRLIRENPYFSNSTPEQQAQAEALCLAQIKADYEMLLAQVPSSDQPQIQPLPELGTFPSSPIDVPTARPEPMARPEPAARPEPMARPPIQPVESSPTQSSIAMPATMPTVDPATIPTAKDPSIYMGPEAEPTPFDGIVIRTLSELPDGNYRYISGAAEERAYSNAELQQRGGSVFVLKKVGDTVIGSLLPKIGLPGICVSGTVNGDVITGAAYPDDTTANSLQDSARQTSESYEPYGSGALEIRQTRTEGEQLYYADALLDLTAFTPINAGASLPPASCQMSRADGRDLG
ncbi:MAG: hypothetical protein WA947_17495 [Phormidesmis sp.]